MTVSAKVLAHMERIRLWAPIAPTSGDVAEAMGLSRGRVDQILNQMGPEGDRLRRQMQANRGIYSDPPTRREGLNEERLQLNGKTVYRRQRRTRSGKLVYKLVPTMTADECRQLRRLAAAAVSHRHTHSATSPIYAAAMQRNAMVAEIVGRGVSIAEIARCIGSDTSAVGRWYSYTKPKT